MNHHLKCLLLFIFISASLVIPIAKAENDNTIAVFDLNLVGRLSLGYASFSFPNRLDHDIILPIYQGSVAVRYQRGFAAFNAANKLSTEDVSNLTSLGSGSRYDYDLAAGAYLIEKDRWNLSWIAGYKWGRADIRYVDRIDTKHTHSDFYKTEGEFTSIALSLNMVKGTRLALSVGYAWLDSSNNFGQQQPDPLHSPEHENPDEPPSEKVSEDIRAQMGQSNGRSRGFSYGINLKIPISAKVSFSSSFKINDYRQDVTINGIQYNDLIDRTVQFTNGISIYY